MRSVDCVWNSFQKIDAYEWRSTLAIIFTRGSTPIYSTSLPPLSPLPLSKDEFDAWRCSSARRAFAERSAAAAAAPSVVVLARRACRLARCAERSTCAASTSRAAKAGLFKPSSDSRSSTRQVIYVGRNTVRECSYSTGMDQGNIEENE